MAPSSPIVCPFELRVHPEADRIENDAQTWATKMGLVEPATARFGWLGAACHPDGETDLVQIATNLVQWIFAFDDSIDQLDGPPWHAARQALLSVRVAEDRNHGIDTAGEPTLAALDNVCARLRKVASAAQYDRFVNGLTEWVLGEVCGGTAKGPPPEADYDTVRRYNTNGMVCYGLIDLVAGVELPESQWREPRTRTLTRIATAIMGYGNDVFSCHKEADEPTVVNLVTVLAHEHDISFDEATILAARRVNSLFRSVHDLASRLRHTADLALNTYLTGLQAWVCGQYHWHILTDRYPTGSRA